MKKYTQYKVSLCIGLLGFNTLSSCTNIREQIYKGRDSYEVFDDGNHSHPIQKKISPWCFFTVYLFAVMFVGEILYGAFNYVRQSTQPKNNGSHLIVSPFLRSTDRNRSTRLHKNALPYNVSTMEAKHLFNAIKNDPSAFVRDEKPLLVAPTGKLRNWRTIR